MITIEVKVIGGKVPAPINVTIDKEGSFDYLFFIRENPFKENFSLSKGKHTISLIGKNPENGKTIITVSGIDSDGNTFKTEKIKESNHYSATFIINF